MAFHPHSLHGGAGVSAATLPAAGERRTLVLRFFGEEARYRRLPIKPEDSMYGLPMPFLDKLADGEPMWHAGDKKQFVQVLGPPPRTLAVAAKL